MMVFTCNLGGDAGRDGRAEALVGGGFEGEEVGGSRVEPNKQMVGLVPELEHPPPLGGQISTRVQGAQCLICNLQVDRENVLNTHLNILFSFIYSFSYILFH